MAKSGQNISASTFSYDYVRLLPKEQIGVHSQPTWELNYIIRGNGIRVIGDTQEAFAEGEVVLVPPQVTHCWYFDANGEEEAIENISVQINEDWLQRLTEVCPETSETIKTFQAIDSGIKFGEKTGTEIARIMVEMRQQPPVLRFSSLIEILNLLTSEPDGESIGRQSVISRDEERRKSIEIYVTCNFARKISLDAIARHVGLSRSAFCRWMQQHMHTTLAAYVQHTRLRVASELLRQNPTMPINEIAYHSGFSDVPYFNRMFKREFGASPKAYREKN